MNLPRRWIELNVRPTSSFAATNFFDGCESAEVTVRSTSKGSSCRQIVSTSGSSGTRLAVPVFGLCMDGSGDKAT